MSGERGVCSEAEGGGEAANGSRSGGSDDGVDMPESERAERVASMEPVPAFLLPRFRIVAGIAGSDPGVRMLPSLFLKMLVNIFLNFTEDVGKRALSPLSKVIDWRGEERGDDAVVNEERGRLEKREETELDVE